MLDGRPGAECMCGKKENQNEQTTRRGKAGEDHGVHLTGQALRDAHAAGAREVFGSLVCLAKESIHLWRLLIAYNTDTGVSEVSQ